MSDKPGTSPTKRLFVAIHVQPDSNFLSIFHKVKSGLKQENIRWIDEKNFHVTLKFIGDTPAYKVDSISNMLEIVAAKAKAFTFVIRGSGVFGSSHKPKVIWFGIDENPDFVSLARDMAESLEKIEIVDDRQNFVPHLTIGRIKFARDKNKLQNITEEFKEKFIQPVGVDSFTLFESTLGKHGPEYHVIKTFQLEEEKESRGNSFFGKLFGLFTKKP